MLCLALTREGKKNIETSAPKLLRHKIFKMKKRIKTIIGAAGLISLGAVGISYFDESIERRTMDGTIMISALPSIVNTNLGISSILRRRLYRVGTSAADTYDKSLFIHSFDLHYEADTLGTFTEYSK